MCLFISGKATRWFDGLALASTLYTGAKYWLVLGILPWWTELRGWIKAGQSTWSSSPHFRVCWGSETVQHAWQGSIYVANWGEPKCESLFCHSAEAGSASCMEAAWSPEDACKQVHTNRHTDNRALQTLAVCNICWLEKGVKYCAHCSSWQLPPLNICPIHNLYFNSPIPTLDPSAAWFPMFAKNRPQLSTV